MQTIARRLGFDLVSLRLELFGRRRPKLAPPGNALESEEELGAASQRRVAR
jgi:Fur family ferric uptake transcriptional regulator